MNHYQLLVLAPGTLTGEEAESVTTEVQKLVESQDGKVTLLDRERFGKRRLAYPIKHMQYGHYTLMEFDVAAEKIAKIDQEIRHNARILRHQLILAPEKTPEQRMAESALREKIQNQRRKKQERQKTQEREERVKEVTKPVEVKERTAEERQAAMEELDKKLDEILSDNIIEN